MKRRKALAEVLQQIRELALYAAFVHVIVPAAAIDEKNFDADVRFEELPDLLQTLAEPAGGILRAIFRLIFRRIGFAEKIDGFKRLRTRAMQRMIHRLRVHRFKPAFNDLPGSRGLRHHLELFQVRQRNRWGSAVQHARKVRAHRHGAERRSVFFRNGFESAIQPAVFG